MAATLREGTDALFLRAHDHVEEMADADDPRALAVRDRLRLATEGLRSARGSMKRGRPRKVREAPSLPFGVGDSVTPTDADRAAIRGAIAPRLLGDDAIATLATRVREAAGYYQATMALREAVKGTKRHRTNLERFHVATLIRDCAAAWSAVTGEPIPHQPAGNRTRGAPDHPCVTLARLAHLWTTGKPLVVDLRRQAEAARTY